jgi:uncharacterized protein (TIGR03067 family)
MKRINASKIKPTLSPYKVFKTFMTEVSMTRRLALLALFAAFLVLVAAETAVSVPGDDNDDSKELKKFEGNWKLTRKEYKGNLWPAAGIVKEGIFMEDGKIVWLRDGKEAGQKGDMTIDATTNPKSIDVEITQGSFIGKKMLGIYEIKGNKLSICWSEPGGEKRPKKFVTKTAVGSGTYLESYQLEGGDKKADDKAAAKGDKKGTAGKKEDSKADAGDEMKKLEGNWKLVRQEYKGNLRPALDIIKPGIFIEDGKIFWTREGKEAGEQKGDLTLDSSTTPKSLDVEITRGSFIGKKLLGIYELKGNKLTICWSEPGGEKRPKKFVTKTAVGSGVSMDTFEKVKD